MKKLTVFISLVLLGICLIALQAQAKVENLNTTIVVFGEAEISAKPNVATICLGVDTERMSLKGIEL